MLRGGQAGEVGLKEGKKERARCGLWQRDAQTSKGGKGRGEGGEVA